MASIEHPSVYAAEEEALAQLPSLEEWTPTEVRNHMQFALAMSHGEDLGDFIEKHAADFGAEFDAHPDEYVAAYRTDAAKTLHDVASHIYH